MQERRKVKYNIMPEWNLANKKTTRSDIIMKPYQPIVVNRSLKSVSEGKLKVDKNPSVTSRPQPKMQYKKSKRGGCCLRGIM